MRRTHYEDAFDFESSAIEPLRQGRIYGFDENWPSPVLPQGSA